MTRDEFELQAALAALAGLRNPREAEYLAQVQARAQAVADAYAERGFFKGINDGVERLEGERLVSEVIRFGVAGLPRGMKPPPIVVPVGMGRPGEGVSPRRVVVNQTQSVPGRPIAPVHHVGAQQGLSSPAHQTTDSFPKPKLQNPKVQAPMVVGVPQPRLTEPTSE